MSESLIVELFISEVITLAFSSIAGAVAGVEGTFILDFDTKTLPLVINILQVESCMIVSLSILDSYIYSWLRLLSCL